MMQSGNVKPVIDRTYPLSQIPDAIHYLEQGQDRGKEKSLLNNNAC